MNKTIKYRDNEDIYIPIKTINKFSPHKNYYASPDHGDSDHICIDEYSFELSFIPDGRYGTVKERDSKKQLIKKFKDLKSLYEYFYKNFDKITKPRSLAEK